MDLGTFWQLVDSTRGHDERVEKLVELLQPFATENIVRFRIHFDDLMNQANRVDLWGAANTLLGQCTEDGFFDFREALIELGHETYELAVRDPDALAAIFEPGQAIPAPAGIANAAVVAWTAVTGESENAFYEAVDAMDAARTPPEVDEGEWWNFSNKDEVRDRLPRLAAKFLKDEG